MDVDGEKLVLGDLTEEEFEEGGFGNGLAIVLRKKSVEAIVRAEGLFFFEFYGLVDNFP